MPLLGKVLGRRGADSVRAQTCRVWPRRAQLRGGQRHGAGKPVPRAEAQLQRLRRFLTARRTMKNLSKERGSVGVRECVCVGAPAGLAGREHALKSLHVREGNASRRGVSSGDCADKGDLDTLSAGPAALTGCGCLLSHPRASGSEHSTGLGSSPKTAAHRTVLCTLLTTWG